MIDRILQSGLTIIEYQDEDIFNQLVKLIKTSTELKVDNFTTLGTSSDADYLIIESESLGLDIEKVELYLNELISLDKKVIIKKSNISKIDSLTSSFVSRINVNRKLLYTCDLYMIINSDNISIQKDRNSLTTTNYEIHKLLKSIKREEIINKILYEK